MKRYTADNITDEEIRALRTEEVYGNRDPNVLGATGNALDSNGGIVGPAGYHAVRESQRAARARCAEILNARAAKEQR